MIIDTNNEYNQHNVLNISIINGFYKGKNVIMNLFNIYNDVMNHIKMNNIDLQYTIIPTNKPTYFNINLVPLNSLLLEVTYLNLYNIYIGFIFFDLTFEYCRFNNNNSNNSNIETNSSGTNDNNELIKRYIRQIQDEAMCLHSIGVDIIILIISIHTNNQTSLLWCNQTQQQQYVLDQLQLYTKSYIDIYILSNNSRYSFNSNICEGTLSNEEDHFNTSITIETYSNALNIINIEKDTKHNINIHKDIYSIS